MAPARGAYYAAKRPRRFYTQSAAALTYVLTKRVGLTNVNAAELLFDAIKLALTLLFVLLVASSRNFAFVEIVGVALLVLLATYEQEKLARVLILPIQALIISLIILAPSLLLGQTRAFVVVPCKTFLTTTAISLLAYSTSRNRFTCAFKSFGAPDSALFIFDLTLKYVVVLGEICLETLEAVRLRSVGRNRRKAQTLGGIVGVAFYALRSRRRSSLTR